MKTKRSFFLILCIIFLLSCKNTKAQKFKTPRASLQKNIILTPNNYVKLSDLKTAKAEIYSNKNIKKCFTDEEISKLKANLEKQARHYIKKVIDSKKICKTMSEAEKENFIDRISPKFSLKNDDPIIVDPCGQADCCPSYVLVPKTDKVIKIELLNLKNVKVAQFENSKLINFNSKFSILDLTGIKKLPGINKTDPVCGNYKMKVTSLKSSPYLISLRNVKAYKQ